MSEELVREHVAVERGQLVMPFYLICDVSYSMVHDMQALNDSAGAPAAGHRRRADRR